MLPPLEPALAIAPLPGAPAERLETARRVLARGVTLDASLRGLRPRELDRSDRRGLCATLRRLELFLGGIDLPIPPEHWSDPEIQDRAVSATRAAVELLREAGSLVETAPILSLSLPEGAIGEAAISAGLHARSLDVTLVDLARPRRDDLPDGWAPGVDLAREIDAGASPLRAISTANGLAAVRLSDADSSGRRTLGEGRLDLGHAAAVIATTAAGAAIVLDPRGLVDPVDAAVRGLAAWRDAADAMPLP